MRPTPSTMRLALLVALLPWSCRQTVPDVTPAPPPAQPTEEALSNLASGVRLLEQFRHQEAEQRFAHALQLQPGWLPAQVDLAIAQMNQLDPPSAERAEASARAALQAAPADARARYVLGYVLAERLGRFDEALVQLRGACEAAPGDPSAWFQRGRSAEEAARAKADAALKAEARQGYEKALELDPRSLEASYRLGRLLLDSDAEADRARAEQLLGDHARLLAGRPAVQPNYLTRGALAQAYPYSPPRVRPPEPAQLSLAPSQPLPLPEAASVVGDEGLSVTRFREGLLIADLDGDSRLDVAAPLRDPRRPDLAWWRQAAPRSFVPADVVGKPGRACSTAAAGDVERDGDLDIVLTCSTGNVLLLRDGGTWKDATPFDFAFPAVAGGRSTLVDFDHDGDLDLHVVQPPESRRQGQWGGDSFLWRNDGKGAFAQVGALFGLTGPLASEALVWTDFDGDNAVDMLAAPASGGLALFQNQREGAFKQLGIPFTLPATAAGPPSIDLDVLDADGDGDQDVVVLAAGKLSVLVNESSPGAPSFRALDLPSPSPTASALDVADVDLDGFRELLVLAPGEPVGSRSMLMSSGDVVVPVRVIGAEGLDSEALATADIDGDGAPDVVVRNARGEPVVLWTSPPSGATWLSLVLAGREGRSNAQGFGAKVSADAGSLGIRFERRQARGLCSNVVAPEVLGLGGRAQADGLTVLWPSGIRQGEADLASGKRHEIAELDRQPSSCPMLYGWDGSAFRFLTDCFDTAPVGLWVGPGAHWAGDPDEALRLRAGWVKEEDGVVNLSVAEFLNETLIADHAGLVLVEHDAARHVVVDEGVRLAAPPQPLVAWVVGEAAAVRATQDGRDVSDALSAEDESVAGFVSAMPWIGLAQPHSIELLPPSRDGLLVLTGSLNFSNSTNLFAASQAGVSAMPARLEARIGGTWREVLVDCGVPAGFHKDVVIDLRALKLPDAPRLRVTTNLQVSWDRAAFYRDAVPAPDADLKPAPLLRAEKRWLGIPREVKGPGNRWRSFPRETLDGASDWATQGGPVTPDGDVRDEVVSKDERLAFVRPGEEMLLAFDAAAAGPLPAGRARTAVLVTRGWVKDGAPQTAHFDSVLPLPKPGAELYP